ncbi:MAG: GNAT family N-acetyltransferase [Thermoproteales archaeon]|nr:GNAT family N-acetyltransferase [Thermoproteales archaeon]
MRVIEKYGSIAKLAYLNSRPVGLIQYQPIPEEKLAEINCIFVPDGENHGKDIGTTLLKALIEEMKEPKPYFDYEKPLALVAWAFRVPGRYPQHEFYQKRGRNF